MEKNSPSKNKELIKQFADNCKVYRDFEEEIKIAKNEFTVSENKIYTLKTEIDELIQQVGDLKPINLDVLNQEISALSDEKSQLGLLALKQRVKTNTLLKQKQNELSDAIHKNELIAKIEEKRTAFTLTSEREEEKQKELKTVIETKGKATVEIAAFIKQCEEFFLNIPEEVLFYLVSESGTDMIHLPNTVLKKALSKGVPSFLKNATVQQQVKLLYPYNIPIYFGNQEWNVLEIHRDRALLLLKKPYHSRQLLGRRYSWETEKRIANMFHKEEVKWLKWEDSDARRILNSEFIEKLRLKENEKILPDANGDKVFCLNAAEVEKYLTIRQRTVDNAWWLRDTKYYNGNKSYGIEPDCTSMVAYVSMFGEINYNPNTWEITRGKFMENICFRPALWVEIPYDPFDTDWNEADINVNCKGKWTVDNCYSNITIDAYSVVRKAEEMAAEASKIKLPDYILVPRPDVTDM